MAPLYEGLLDQQHWNQQKNELGRNAQTWGRWFVDILRPAILTRGGQRKQTVRRTAYLDGLRGFAAFIVYWQHHQLWPLRKVLTGRIIETGYGFEGRYVFAALPLVRTFFSGGHFAVSLFFVISGYVLSMKPLSLIHTGQFEAMATNVGGALLKRWARLHIPIIIVTLAWIISWHWFGLWTISPDHAGNFRDELWNWYIEFKNFSFAFRTGGETWFSYNFPTWSIPVEFRGSIIIYTSLLAFAKMSTNFRLGATVGLIYYFLYIVDGWFGAFFMAGMLLAELDILARKEQLPHFIKRLEPFKTPILYTMLIASIFLSGVPSHMKDRKFLSEAPGWRHLDFLVPQAVFDFKWFFLFWAAICFITCAQRIGWLRSFFELPFNLYLGRISFSFYLVHGPILWSLGDRIYCAVGWYKQAHETHIPGWIGIFPLPESGPLGLEPRFLIPHLIILPFTLWVAEVTTKLCDEPSARFAQWMYNVSLARPEQPLELPMERPADRRDP